ncbi:hypothetical protein BH24ACT9_BH24ACT9_13240 [soil metagenome]|jgi:hypothetical protein
MALALPLADNYPVDARIEVADRHPDMTAADLGMAQDAA